MLQNNIHIFLNVDMPNVTAAESLRFVQNSFVQDGFFSLGFQHTG